MSHRILKTSLPEQRGLLSDVSDMAESYWYWAKNKLMETWSIRKGEGSRRKNEWTISEFRTDNVVVHHAIDDGAVDGYQV